MKKQLVVFLVMALMLACTSAGAETAPTLEALSELEWLFCSGAGAWSTTIWIAPDGSFTGEYHDSEMGDAGEDYPDGSIYGCLFHGQLTLGENMADHGGLQVAFQAFKNATKDAPLADHDGFTPEQRFFLAMNAMAEKICGELSVDGEN